MLAYGKPSHFFRFGVDCHHYGSGASGSRILAANVDPSILLAAGEKISHFLADGWWGETRATDQDVATGVLTGQPTTV